jgi:tetratricopeptide (TPR) repeat protein
LHNLNEYFYDSDRNHLLEAEAFGRKALALDDSEAMCHIAVAQSLTFQRRLDDARPYYERAVALNSNNTFILMVHAMWLSYSGHSAEALASMNACLRRDPMAKDWFWDVLAITQTAAGLCAEALASFKRMGIMSPWGHAYKAICHIGLGQLPEARAAAAQFIIHSRPGTVASLLDSEPYSDPAVIARFRAALLAAGVPEGKCDSS